MAHLALLEDLVNHELCREHDAVFASEHRVASEGRPHHKTDTAAPTML